jgi:signal transduction histidine kinase
LSKSRSLAPEPFRGDLNFSLPRSQVREVAEVALAFEEMGRALEQALGRQGELEQERRLFISAIAHDLRTPLFSLRGYLEGLEKGLATTPEKAAHYLAICREKAADLEKRISNLFTYARLEHVEQAVGRQRLDLNVLLKKVVESFRPQAETKQIQLELSNWPEPACIQADEQLLSRVFENLLDNALRYTGEKGRIEVGLHKVADRICFKVEDTGAGIAPQDLPHIFEPLYQGEAARNGQRGGTGLGLTIARRILLAYQGELQVSNREGGGASFTGWLNSEVEYSGT